MKDCQFGVSPVNYSDSDSDYNFNFYFFSVSKSFWSIGHKNNILIHELTLSEKFGNSAQTDIFLRFALHV